MSETHEYAELHEEIGAEENSSPSFSLGMLVFYLLVFIMPLERHPIWSRMIGGLTLTKYVGIASTLYALFYLTARRAPWSALRSSVAKLFLVFYTIAAISHISKGPPGEVEFNPFVSYTSFLLLFFVAVTLVDSLERLRRTLLVAIGSVGLASAYVIREWQHYHNIYLGFRPGWVVGDANYFALSAVLCAPLAFYLMKESEVLWERIYCLGCLLLTLAAVALSASRGGFLGLIVAFLFFIKRSAQPLRNFLLVTVLSAPIIIFAPASPVQRLLHPNYSDTSAEDSRLELWRAGLRMIAQHPWTGIGLGNFKYTVAKYEGIGEHLEKIAHNTYIGVAAEMGLPNLLVFALILFFAFRNLSLARQLSLDEDVPLVYEAATGIQAGLLGAAVAIFFLSAETQKLLWLMIFLAPTLLALTEYLVLEKEQYDGAPSPASDPRLAGQSPIEMSSND